MRRRLRHSPLFVVGRPPHDSPNPQSKNMCSWKNDWLMVVSGRNGLGHEEVQFAPPLAERQTGPFYATTTPIRIVKVSKVGDCDPFSLS